jgi:dienelactone hydrolase
MSRPSIPRLVVGLAAFAVVLLSLWRLHGAEAGLTRRDVAIGATPATVLAPRTPGRAPAVVIAHGFSGSRPLMRPFAAALARAGYVAVTFDFLGHGEHPAPLTGDVTTEEGATAALVAQLRAVVDHARTLPGTDGRVALLGHSMASDVVVRAALADPGVGAVVAVSMFSPAVTAEAPRNLLVVAGEWEAPLADEALRVLRLTGGPDARAGVTVEDPEGAGRRRAVIAPSVEHIGVLYSATATAEAVAWLDAVFWRTGGAGGDARGGWILALLAALTALGWPLAALLPRAVDAPAGAGLRGWRLGLAILGPAVLTPLIATQAQVRLLPVIVGDYLALHFALYGLMTAAAMRALGGPLGRGSALRAGPLALAAAAVAAYGLLAVGGALDAQVSNFLPTAGRLPLLGLMLVGMVPYFLADEWLTRGPAAPGWAYGASKLAFLGSLAAAVALDPPRLFFLIILAPALVVFFTVFGLFSGWTYRAVGHPAAGALANAAVFAVAVATTFPQIAG